MHDIVHEPAVEVKPKNKEPDDDHDHGGEGALDLRWCLQCIFRPFRAAQQNKQAGQQRTEERYQKESRGQHEGQQL